MIKKSFTKSKIVFIYCSSRINYFYANLAILFLVQLTIDFSDHKIAFFKENLNIEPSRHLPAQSSQ